jgi:hypothetical protein
MIPGHRHWPVPAWMRAIRYFFFFAFFLGRLLRSFEAIFFSSDSDIESAIDLEAPLSLRFGVWPRLAERAAPAAFCWAFDFAGMSISFRNG